MSILKSYITLGTTSFEITAGDPAENATELIPKSKIVTVTPVPYQERGVDNTDWTYPYDSITIIRLTIRAGKTYRFLDFELQSVQDQPTWSGGTLADLQTAIADINAWLPSGTVTTPTITILPTSLSFPDTYEGQESLEDSFVIMGSDLTDAITISFPTGFKGSTISGGPYSSSDITLTPSGGTVPGTSIYVVFSPLAVQSYSDVISCSSSGASTQDVSVDGDGVSSLHNMLTASYSLNGNALKNVGSNNGTATNVTWDYAVFDKGGIFNGTSKISIPDSADFTFGSNDWAYSIDIRRGLTGTREIFTGQSNNVGTTPTVSWWLEFNTSNELVFIGTNGTTGSPISINTGFAISDKNWHNIVAQRVGNNIELYVDASLVSATTPFSTGDTINNSSFPWGIGNAGDLSILQFTGQIDEVALWNGRYLTSQEITDLQTQCYPFNTLTFETETNAYVAQLSPAPNLLTQVIYNQFFLNLKGLGVTGSYNNLAEIDRLWLFANAAQQNARVSMVNPTSTQVTEVNAPSWIQNQGYYGDAITSYLNLRFNAYTQGVKFQLNSASFFFYSLSSASQLTSAMGAWDSGGINKTLLAFPNDSSNSYAYINSSASTNNVTIIDERGLNVFVRNNPTQQSTYLNGILLQTYLSNSTDIPNLNNYGLGINKDGGLSYPDNRVYSVMGFASGNLDQASFNQAIQNIAASLGFKV